MAAAVTSMRGLRTVLALSAGLLWASALPVHAQNLPPAPTLTPGAGPAPQRSQQAAPQTHGAVLPITVQRPATATAAIATRRGDFRIWYDPSLWRPAPESEDGRIELRHPNGQGVVVIIPEGTPLPLVALRTAAIENARRTAPDARIVAEQTRRIANRDVLLLQIEGTLSAGNRAVTYLGHYFGDPRGSIQVVAATAQRDFERLRTALQDAIDGLDLNRP